MKNIITIQHTQSVHHCNGMVGSWTDWELSELGKEHAENIGRKLSAELMGQTWKIYSSDLLRAKQTAEPLARYMGVEVEYFEKLREGNQGEAVGKSREWSKANRLKLFDDEFDVDFAYFNGAETWREFWNRVAGLQNDIIADETKNIILVSHGGTLAVWHQLWIGAEIHMPQFVKAGGVSFFRIDAGGERVVKRFSDLTYIGE